MTGRSSSTVMFYICLGCPRGNSGLEACKKKKKKRETKKKCSHCSLSLSLLNNVFIKWLSQVSYGHRKRLFLLLTVSLWARYRGLTQQKRKINTKVSNVQRVVVIQTASEIYAGMEPLGFHLVEVITFDRADRAPCCTYLSSRTSLWGPRADTSAPFKTVRTGQSGSKPKCLKAEEKPLSHKSTDNEATILHNFNKPGNNNLLHLWKSKPTL